MWFSSKKRDAAKQLPPGVAPAIIMAALSLALSAGVARWSWLILDEQIALRKEFVELKNEQVQTNIQYEYWLGKIRTEREEWRKMNESAPKQ